MLAVYMPSSYVHSRRAMEKYATMGGGGNLTLGGRETGVRRLMTTNLLKRLESSVCSFRLTLERVLAAMNAALKTIDDYRRGLASGASVADGDLPGGFDFDPDDESGFEVGGATKILVDEGHGLDELGARHRGGRRRHRGPESQWCATSTPPTTPSSSSCASRSARSRKAPSTRATARCSCSPRSPTRRTTSTRTCLPSRSASSASSVPRSRATAAPAR